jgi:NAD(P)H dehydrogenase (quinone)
VTEYYDVSRGSFSTDASSRLPQFQKHEAAVMLALIVVAHPSPDSLSHAMASAAERVLVARNYGSSNVLVEQHCSELASADLILVFHPNWWGQPPAILKGWIDRVFRLNTAYAYPPGVGFEGVPVGLLRARLAIVVNTSNTSAEREALAFGDPLETLWKNCVFGLCGVSSVIRRMYAPVSGSTAQQRAAWLYEFTALLENEA